ncbi:MAG: DUF3850 domain-containing protein [Deltaproteobacteria bacterium]|nr:DUF3850 domain-containing protein [Deltaproteobacteria bacterium]
MNHYLKIFPCYFNAIVNGDKLFEIRDNSDRGFQKGDTVIFKEYDKSKNDIVENHRYTGNEITVKITYITNVFQKPDYVVFSFKVIEKAKNDG